MGLFDRFKTPSVSADEARELVRAGAQLVDVREPAEWNAGHAPQATHIPAGQLAAKAGKLKQGKQIVVVCRSGNRSKAATAQLRQLGYDAVNCAGGMMAWQAAGGQVVDRKGRPASV